MKSFTISENDAGQRADKFITKAVPLLPKSLLHKYLRKKRIKLNRKRCEPATFLQEGDILELYINDEFFENTTSMDFKKAPTDINIIYEDDNLIIVDKPVGLVVHEDSNGTIDTLINRIIHYLYESGSYSPEQENSFVPALCNRIDRNTCGVVIAAKNAKALRTINEKIREREITKRYFCLVSGVPPKKSDIIECWIKKNSEDNTVSITKNEVEDSLYAKTGYEVVKTNHQISLVNVELFTGRTHQIRAVMSYIGNPILGDSKYGGSKELFKHQALCSYSISFNFEDENQLSYLKGKTFTIKGNPFPQIDFK